MGKSWQDDQGKLTPSSCFMKAWLVCRQQRKEAAEVKKVGIYSKRNERRMESVQSLNVSVRAFLYPLPLLAFVRSQGLNRTSTAPRQTQP